MWSALVKPISDVVNKVIDKVAPDAGTAEKLKAAFAMELLKVDSDGLKAQVSIILAEANGESWLQRNWRPLLMIWFAMLISAYWFGYTPENLTEKIVLKLFSIIQLGIGGYVIGRTGEKMMKEYKK